MLLLGLGFAVCVPTDVPLTGMCGHPTHATHALTPTPAAPVLHSDHAHHAATAPCTCAPSRTLCRYRVRQCNSMHQTRTPDCRLGPPPSRSRVSDKPMLWAQVLHCICCNVLHSICCNALHCICCNVLHGICCNALHSICCTPMLPVVSTQPAVGCHLHRPSPTPSRVCHSLYYASSTAHSVEHRGSPLLERDALVCQSPDQDAHFGQ